MSDLALIKEAVAREVDAALKKFREAYAIQAEKNKTLEDELLRMKSDLQHLTQKYAEIVFKQPL